MENGNSTTHVTSNDVAAGTADKPHAVIEIPIEQAETIRSHILCHGGYVPEFLLFDALESAGFTIEGR